MKNTIFLILLIILSSCTNRKVAGKPEKNSFSKFIMAQQTEEEEIEIKELAKGQYPIDSVVYKNGSLKVEGRFLLNEHNEKVRLRGISSHGLQWYGDFSNKANLEVLSKEWGIDIFRIAMYTVEGGYIQNKTVKSKVIELVDICEELGIYVVIDWHMLLDNNPNKYIDESMTFFKEMATLFKKKKHVIFEIANEPNGREVTWVEQIKPYAEELVKEIRSIKKDSLIIVGTPTWSQDVDSIIDNELPYDNIMYTLHFYAGTHGEYLRKKAEKAFKHGIPIFVTEWGTTQASGDGGVFRKESEIWLKWMKKNNLSWINWNLSNKGEDSAILLPSTSYRFPIEDSNLSPSGKLIKNFIINDY